VPTNGTCTRSRCDVKLLIFNTHTDSENAEDGDDRGSDSLGHWDLFKICLEIAESGEIRGASEEELVPLAKLAEESRPLFEGASV